MSARQQRTRRRKPPGRVVRPFWFIIVVLAVLVVIGIYGLSTWPALYPHTINVFGNRVVSESEIVSRAQINLTRNMWMQNTGAMVGRIEAIPYIESARIHRQPPDTMLIYVTERAPYAVVDDRGQRVTIDKTMRVLQQGAPLDSPFTLPVLEVTAPTLDAPGSTFANANVATLVGCAGDFAAAHLDAATLSFDRYGDVVVTLRSGIRVLLGDPTTVAPKVMLVGPILAKVEHGRRRVAALDLRAITTPVVVYAK